MKAYQYKITLKKLRPPVWRRIVIPACLSFQSLSDIIQGIFGFHGYHQSEFEFPDGKTMRDLNIRIGREKSMIMEDHVLEEYEGVKKFSYLYDFGDSWEFDVVLEKILEDYENNYPAVLKFRGDNLVEDCGGVFAYMGLLEAWEKGGDAYDEIAEWAGEKEDYVFDMEDANRRLKNFACREDGSFVSEALEEDDFEEEEEEEIPDVQEFLEGLDIDQLRNQAKENGDQGLEVLLDILTNPVEGLRLANAQRLPKNLEELKVAYSFVRINALVSAAYSVHQYLDIPVDIVVDAFGLAPGLSETLRAMVRKEYPDAK